MNKICNIMVVTLMAFVASLMGGLLFAAQAVDADLNPSHGFLPPEATHINWVFSGMVVNENGENYNYLFQMQRNQNTFHAKVALFDAQTKEMMLFEENHAVIDDPDTYNWCVGSAFLRFNPINASWIFGFSDHDKKGFNFKVDMLKQEKYDFVIQNLRPGVDFVISQTGQLNGHIRTGSELKEQFVTAKNAWFRQLWLTNQQDKHHQFSGVLCQFNDGSGFYSMNMPESDALRGAIAGWFDADGVPVTMSQFIHTKQTPNGPWRIQIVSPSMDLMLTDLIKQSTVVAGFVDQKDKQGFCMLSEDDMG